MNDHTPGPWIVFVGDDDFDVLPAGRAGEIAGRITNSSDASLIAAAPDMLNLLHAARIILNNRDQDTREAALLKAIKVVIAKAEGPQTASEPTTSVRGEK